MKSPPQLNHLALARQLSGLSRKYVIALLGRGSVAELSLYESGKRKPSLHNLIALELIYGLRLPELFPAEAQPLSFAIGERAAKLARDLARVSTPTESERRRFETLLRLASLGGNT